MSGGLLGDWPVELRGGSVHGRGCERCRFTGFSGRMAVGEVLTVSSSIRRLVQQNASPDMVKEAACREGMRLLRDNALRAVSAGRTSVSEVLRVTQEDF